MSRRWMFLGVAVDVLTEPGAPVAVAAAVLPDGASPPLHFHDDLDDSFYVLDGHMIVRCGDDVFVARPGTWVQFPHGVPHTFRVLGGPARILLAHANDSFIRAVQTIGRPTDGNDMPTTSGDSVESLDEALAEFGITSVGPPMEQPEADAWLRAVS